PYPERRPFSISRAAWDMAGSFQAMARARGKQLEVHIQDGICVVGEESALQRLISILLNNGVKYAEEGSTIRFSLFCRRKTVFLETEIPCAPMAEGDA